MTDKKFQRQAFQNRLMDRVDVRDSANKVLSAILRQMSFEAPTSRITKARIHQETRLTRKTILRALGELKSKGIISVLSNGQGGRSIAPTYRVYMPDIPSETQAKERRYLSNEEADEILRKAGFRPKKRYN